MTPEEKHLWYDFLKRLPMNVRRQHNIENYIVDFYIAEKKIVIEIDGRQHLLPEHSLTGIEHICLRTINPRAFVRPLS